MNELIGKFRDWLMKNNPAYFSQLLPGLSNEEVVSFEQTINVKLPAEFKKLYQWRAGHPDNEAFAWPFWDWMNVNDIISTMQILNELLKEGDFEEPNWWSFNWIPFLANAAGDFYCIDTEGSFGGSPGQILIFLHDSPARDIIYKDFGKWFRTTIGALEAGLFTLGELDYQIEAKYYQFEEENNPGYPMRHNAG